MRKFWIYFSLFLILFIFVFRSLVFNLTTNLIDWRDYALMVWIVFQNVSKIQALDFQNFFNTTSFYPNPNTLFFSDLLLPQSIIALPIYWVVKNLILTFNLVFIITFILNYISTFLFWRLIFKKDLFAFIGSLLFIFSPFFHLNISHFQMLSYWPFFFSLYFLFKPQSGSRLVQPVIAGLFITVQFLASVYLSVYLLTTIGLYFIFQLTRKSFKQVGLSAIVVFLTFFLTSGIFIKGYFDVKKEYDISRNIDEYITYSASLSDYIFTFSVDSLITRLPVIQKWNSFNKNGWGGHTAFPGVLVLSLGLIGLFAITKDKKSLSVIMNLNRQKGFFLSLVLLGFIFSLGPRLNFNGTYAHIPLPYAIALKVVPLFESTRVSARWSYLFYFGLIFFALLGLQKIADGKYKSAIFAFCFVMLFLEALPFNLTTTAGSYVDDRTEVLRNICSDEKQVLLELPVTHLEAGNNIVEGLTYLTTSQLASTFHGCYLVNGYSGYDLPEIRDLSIKMDQLIDQNKPEQFISELKQRHVNLVKFNPDNFPNARQANLQQFFSSLEELGGLNKIDSTIYEIK